MKRKLKMPSDSSSKVITPCNIWRSASTFSNFFRQEPLIDYLDKYRIYSLPDLSDHLAKRPPPRFRRRPQPSGMFAHLVDKGHTFEADIFATLKSSSTSFFEFPNHVKEIFKDENYVKTIELLQDPSVDLIFHPVVRNYSTNTFGAPDLIIRGRLIKKLFSNPPSVNDTHFYIVDVKASSLDLDSSGTYLQNSSLYDGYKSQLYIYTAALREMTKDSENIAFVLGKGLRYKEENIKNPFHSLGLIDYNTRDQWVAERMPDAIEWLNRLENDGDSWTLSPPSIPELCPNMTNTYDKNLGPVKKFLSRTNGEITQLWQCGTEQRKKAYENGIISIHHDQLTPEALGFDHSNKKYTIISRLLEMRTSTYNYLIPFDNNVFNWREKVSDEIFVDFETFYGDDDETFIFLIGAYHKGKYLSWKAESYSPDSERKVWKDFCDWTQTLPPTTRLIHWGNIEKVLMKKLAEKHGGTCEKTLLDLLEVFRDNDNPIIIKGCYDFSLKSIVRSLYQFREIPDTYDGDISDGSAAMTIALNVYRHGLEMSELDEVIAYNRKDCRVLSYILDFLRR